MNLIDITPVGAFMNAIEAAAEKDRQIARLENKNGIDRSTSRPKITKRVSSAILGVVEATAGLYRAATLRRAPQRHR